MDGAAESFWQFSNRVYALPGVADICLQLQDDCNADVNLLLFACWYARVRGRLDSQGLAAAEATVSAWRENTVQPLRQVRRWLKHSAEADAQALREEVKRLELEAERLQQEMLARLVTTLQTAAPASPLTKAPARATIAANIRLYLDSLQSAPPPTCQRAEKDIRPLIDAASA